MLSRQVSFMSIMSSEFMPSLLQRILTCARLSSAEAYRTLYFFESDNATCVIIVDLPIPGSPPISTSDDGTMPPPRTVLSSSIPESIRSSFSCSTSESLTGLLYVGRFVLSVCGVCSSISSLIVPNFPHEGHLPSQPGVTAPHSEQTYFDVILLFAIFLPLCLMPSL